MLKPKNTNHEALLWCSKQRKMVINQNAWRLITSNVQRSKKNIWLFFIFIYSFLWRNRKCIKKNAKIIWFQKDSAESRVESRQPSQREINMCNYVFKCLQSSSSGQNSKENKPREEYNKMKTNGEIKRKFFGCVVFSWNQNKTSRKSEKSWKITNRREYTLTAA